jgi:molybdopterin converting factor small subunit
MTGTSDSRRITVQYFAVLRERRGLAEEDLWTSARTAADVYDELDARHGFDLDRGGLKLVINEEFAEWSSEISEGDTIVFIPPVAGGCDS